MSLSILRPDVIILYSLLSQGDKCKCQQRFIGGVDCIETVGVPFQSIVAPVHICIVAMGLFGNIFLWLVHNAHIFGLVCILCVDFAYFGTLSRVFRQTMCFFDRFINLKAVL